MAWHRPTSDTAIRQRLTLKLSVTNSLMEPLETIHIFWMVAPQGLKSLTISIRKAVAMNHFKSQLKAHYFKLAYF